MRRRAYRSVSVQSVELAAVQAEYGELKGSVGIDVCKDELLVDLRYGDGAFERPWRCLNLKERDSNHGGKALIGIMRKLALALYHVGARGATYQPTRIFTAALQRRPAPPPTGG